MTSPATLRATMVVLEDALMWVKKRVVFAGDFYAKIHCKLGRLLKKGNTYCRLLY